MNSFGISHNRKFIKIAVMTVIARLKLNMIFISCYQSLFIFIHTQMIKYMEHFEFHVIKYRTSDNSALCFIKC